MPVPRFYAGTHDRRRLTFVRPAYTMDDGEQMPNFENGRKLSVVAFVVPVADARRDTEKLVDTYVNLYDVIVDGRPDIRGRDQCELDGQPAEVIQSSQLPGHLELLMGTLATILPQPE